MSEPGAGAGSRRRSPKLRWFAAGLLVLALLLGEWAGWPFLRGPLQAWANTWLDRSVVLGDDSSTFVGVRIRLLGRMRLQAPSLTVGAPPWQKSTPHTLRAADVRLVLRYGDLWRAWRGDALRIHELQASTLDAMLERRADGGASWQVRTAPGGQAAEIALPELGSLRVGRGTVHVVDALTDTDVQIRMALRAGPDAGAPSGSARDLGASLNLTAHGKMRAQALELGLDATGALPLLGDPGDAATNLQLHASWGKAMLEFDGQARDALRMHDVRGRFLVAGPSLAAVADPLGLTLPSTGAFRAAGRLARNGDIWSLVVDDATVGSSKLKGAFQYDAGAPVPLLSGRVGGARLYLADLGPAIGAGQGAQTARDGKVLPTRPFDLQSLRVMQANVLIDVLEVDLNTALLEPLRPLHAHVRLTDGVLRLDAIDARTAQGQLRGTMQLDARSEPAVWSTDLRWGGIRLERWIRQLRGTDAPPFVSGVVDGSAQLTGRGRSSAQILASVDGQMRVFVRQGAVSHLVVELAGADLFQGLGVLIKGDEALQVHCAAADLVATKGVLRPRIMVIDTDDSVLSMDGSVSLADEKLDLRVRVMPKDFSLLTLRSPLRVHGPLSGPTVALEPQAVGIKVAGAVLLGLINPLAALIPLIDPGDSGKSGPSSAASAGCRALAERAAASAARKR